MAQPLFAHASNGMILVDIGLSGGSMRHPRAEQWIEQLRVAAIDARRQLGVPVPVGLEHPRRPLVVTAGLVWRPGGVLLVQRRSVDAGHGDLELPGGKLEPGEHPRQALARALVEEWGPAAAALRVGQVADVLRHVYPPPGPEVVLVVYHVDASGLGAPGLPLSELGLRPEPGVELARYPWAELPVEDFLAADRELVEAVRAGVIAVDHGTAVESADDQLGQVRTALLAANETPGSQAAQARTVLCVVGRILGLDVRIPGLSGSRFVVADPQKGTR